MIQVTPPICLRAYDVCIEVAIFVSSHPEVNARQRVYCLGPSRGISCALPIRLMQSFVPIGLVRRPLSAADLLRAPIYREHSTCMRAL